MTTLSVSVTDDWVDIKSSLSLTEGASYVIDGVMGGITHIRQSSSTPTDTFGICLEPKQSRTFLIGTEGLWVKADSADKNTKIVLEQEPEAAALTENGSGAVGTGVEPSTTRIEQDGVIITSIKIDLTGLASAATANDVIGTSTGTVPVAFVGRNVLANNGMIFKTECSCLETPVGGDDDVNFVSNVSGVLEYDDAGGTTYISNSGDLLAGQTIQNLLPAITEDHYFYMTAGTGDVAGVYTAGQFLLRLFGHPILT